MPSETSEDWLGFSRSELSYEAAEATRTSTPGIFEMASQTWAGKELHVILDNLSTHKVQKEAWAKSHPEVHFHFTPTHASWRNQGEVRFSIFTAKALRGKSFRSVKELTSHIDAVIAAYNQEAAPFEWTHVKVNAKTFAGKYANLFKSILAIRTISLHCLLAGPQYHQSEAVCWL